MPAQPFGYYEIVYILFPGILEAMMAMTLARVLTMRSNAALYAIYAIDFVVNAVLREVGFSPLIRTVVLVLFVRLGIPVLMSTSSLRERLARTTIVELGQFLAEAIGMTVYAFLSGGDTQPSGIGPDNVGDVVFVYLILIVTTAIVYGTMVAVFARIDGRGDSPTGQPSALMLLGSIVSILLVFYKTLDNEAESSPQTLLLVLYCWLALIGSAVVIAVARREAASQREAAEAALTARRVRHTRGEVEALARRAEGMGSLRHALANDARAVRRLAGAGDVAGADRRLLELQGQARVLIGGRNE